MIDNAPAHNYADLAADIVSAYVTKNSVPVADLPALIARAESAHVASYPVAAK